MNNLTPKQRIEKAHVRMMGHKATLVYSSVLMVGAVTVTDEIPTACTNGRDVTYGESFINRINDKELVGVVLHENLHKVYQHHWLWKELWKEDAQLANMAADYVINFEIVDLSRQYPDFIALPEGGLYDEQYRGMDTKQVFELLKKQGQGNGGGQGGGFDVHDFDDLPSDVQEEVRKEIEQAVRQGQLLAGKQGGDLSRNLEALTKPRVDWREQLREFMSEVSTGKDDSTWRRPNRRWIAQDMYMPSSVSETMGTLVVGIDTSGSISGELVSRFLSEVVGICDNVRPEALHILDVDTDVAKHRVFSQDELHKVAQIDRLHGGGGTDMRAIFDYVDKHNLKPEAVVVLTDGYTPFPTSTAYKSLWAITSPSITSPVGSSIHVDL